MPKNLKFADNAQGVIKRTCTHETGELVSIQNNQVVTTSLKIAEVFGKTHYQVLRDIRNLECSTAFQEYNFVFSFYIRKLPNSATKKEPMYYLTRDGFIFLAMGFTGKVASQFKEAYINAFNEMENKLRGIMINEAEITSYLRELCENMDYNMKEHDKKLKKQFGVMATAGVFSPLPFCSGSLKDQLKYIFATLNNDVLAGQFAIAKLDKIDKENKEMKDKLVKVANELLNYY